jgi:hypothetical protein
MLANILEKGMGTLKDEKISIGLAVGVVCSLYYVFAWAQEEHKGIASQASIERSELVNKKEFHELLNVITAHTEEFRIVNASQIIRDYEMQLQISLATGKTGDELAHIEKDISGARLYRQCLIEQKPNCQHLKPPE